MNILKRFLWQKHYDNIYIVTDKLTGKESFVNKHINGKFTIDNCKLTTINSYGQEIPYFFENKFEVMNYLLEN